MWFALSLLSAVFYASLWLFARASRGMPSSIVTAIQFSPGPVILALSLPGTALPWDQPSWLVYLASQFLIIPPFAWAMNHVSQRVEVTVIKPLSSISSISAAFAGIAFFGDQFSPLSLAGIAIGTMGLLLLYHARWNVWRTPYPWIVLASVLAFGVNAALMGHVLSYWKHPIAMAGLAMTSTFLFTTIPALSQRASAVWTQKRVLLMLSFVAAMIAQELSTMYAFALAPSAAYVVSVKRTSIIMAALAGYLLFNERETPLPRLILSAGLTSAGVAVLFLA